VCSHICICFSCFIISVPFFLVWAFVNSVAWAYGSTQALPWGTVLLLGLLWALCKYIIDPKEKPQDPMLNIYWPLWFPKGNKLIIRCFRWILVAFWTVVSYCVINCLYYILIIIALFYMFNCIHYSKGASCMINSIQYYNDMLLSYSL